MVIVFFSHVVLSVPTMQSAERNEVVQTEHFIVLGHSSNYSCLLLGKNN